MHTWAICLGFALTLGVLPNCSIGQTPSSSATAQGPAATAQNPAQTTRESENSPNTQPDKVADDHDRKWNLRLGTISVGIGYSQFSGPLYYPFSFYGFYPFDRFYGTWIWDDPFWASPLSYRAGLGYNDGRGEVKLTLEPKTVEPKLAEVYVDNAYAGTADHLKNIWLEPGAYDLLVSSKNHVPFRRRIYVLSGRSLKITAKLNSGNTTDATEAKP